MDKGSARSKLLFSQRQCLYGVEQFWVESQFYGMLLWPLVVVPGWCLEFVSDLQASCKGFGTAMLGYPGA
jgi:hypothetical protein